MTRWAPIVALLFAMGSALAAEPPVRVSPSEAPAAPSKGGDESRVHASFEAFAADWMQNAQQLEARHRSHPTVRPGAEEPVVSYRGYDGHYTIEIRATGHVAAPWVGLLRYTELLYTCRSLDAQACTVASSVPITEIFRFRDGHWTY